MNVATAEYMPMIDDPNVISQAAQAGQTAISSTGVGPVTIGGVVGALIAGVLYLKKYLSGESVNTAANAAQTELINLLRAQLEKESARADKAETERAKAYADIEGLKDQIYELNVQVRTLKGQVATLGVTGSTGTGSPT